MAPLIPLLLPLIAAFEVHGDAGCPNVDDLRARLADVPSASDEIVELEVSSEYLRVRLRDPAGALVGERDLDRKVGCAELMEAVAVLISVWTIDLPGVEIGPAPGDVPMKTAPAVPRLPSKPAAPEPTTIETERAVDGRAQHELLVGFSHGIGSRLTYADGLLASYRYWLLEGAGIEAVLNAYPRNGLGGLAQEVELSGLANALSDEHAPEWSLGAGAVVSLARAPMHLIGLLEGPSLEIYAAIAAGVGNVRRPATMSLATETPESNRIAPIFQAGGGLRVFAFREAIALEIELRELFFPDPSGGITQSLQLQGGLRISLDPAGWHDSGDAVEPPLRSLANHLSITPAAGISLVDPFVRASALTLDLDYDIFDFLAVEVLGSYLFASPSGLTRELLDKGKLTPELARLTQLDWALAAGVRVNVVRSRLTPLGIPFDGDLTLYLAAGAGVGSTRVPCTPGMALDPDVFGLGATCPPADEVQGDRPVFVYEPNRLKVLGHVGGGINFSLFDAFALTVELRDYIFHARVVRPEVSAPTQQMTAATRHVLLAQAGVTATFF